MTDQAGVFNAREQDLSVADFRRVLLDSGLGATRPVADEARLVAMLAGANLIVSARRGGPQGEVVGIDRCMTDFTWSCYLSELAVSQEAQGSGIGKGLLDEARRQLGPQVAIILGSVPDAVGFYEKAGMEVYANAFWYRRTS
ncbi:GNAT family N-acetyltransferase [Bosea sp. (in: a-proteobacteria)]|uniref:GNAT family N-acetyltransferase n=1 Tax=Bosea sp. (in: a-proteobacteria) TaxID=1871050 RepID=UPI002FCB2410